MGITTDVTGCIPTQSTLVVAVARGCRHDNDAQGVCLLVFLLPSQIGRSVMRYNLEHAACVQSLSQEELAFCWSFKFCCSSRLILTSSLCSSSFTSSSTFSSFCSS